LASHSLAAPAAARPVTTTDAWKLFAITVVLIDHYGLYFDPADPWWRLFGRLAAPVFFFFIGFARTRTVPWTWIVLGAVITAVDHWTSGGRNLMANILINFALLRLALPAIEAHVIPYPWRLAVTVAVSGCGLCSACRIAFTSSSATGHLSCGATCSLSRPVSPTSCGSVGVSASIRCSRRSLSSW
jgi:hypothetical protein